MAVTSVFLGCAESKAVSKSFISSSICLPCPHLQPTSRAHHGKAATTCFLWEFDVVTGTRGRAAEILLDRDETGRDRRPQPPTVAIWVPACRRPRLAGACPSSRRLAGDPPPVAIFACAGWAGGGRQRAAAAGCAARPPPPGPPAGRGGAARPVPSRPGRTETGGGEQPTGAAGPPGLPVR